MRKKVKLLFALIVTILFVWACYLIYNMKDDVKPIDKPEESKVNETVIVKKLNLDNFSNEYYYVEFNFTDKQANLYKVVKENNGIRYGEAAITIYKQSNLFLNETELENYENSLNKIYNNPYRYGYLNNNSAKELDKDSNDYYEIEFEDTKYFVYEHEERIMFDDLFN